MAHLDLTTTYFLKVMGCLCSTYFLKKSLRTHVYFMISQMDYFIPTAPNLVAQVGRTRLQGSSVSLMPWCKAVSYTDQKAQMHCANVLNTYISVSQNQGSKSSDFSLISDFFPTPRTTLEIVVNLMRIFFMKGCG